MSLDTPEECPHLSAEKEGANHGLGKTLEGSCNCLASQLIGEPLAAKKDHSQEREIGKFPICFD